MKRCRKHPNTDADEDTGLCPHCVADNRLLRIARDALRIAGEAELLEEGDAKLAPAKLREALDALHTARLQVRHHAGVWQALLIKTT